MKIKTTLAACLFALTGVAQAADLEVALSQKSAAFQLISDSAGIGVGGADLGFGVLFNEDDDTLLDLSMTVNGRPAGEQPLTFGLGGKLMYASIDSPDTSAVGLALGGKVAYHIPSNTPVTLSAAVFFAPEITTFSDGKQMSDLLARVEVDVLPSATAFIGFRSVNVELDNAANTDYDIDDNVHVGIRFQF